LLLWPGGCGQTARPPALAWSVPTAGASWSRSPPCCGRRCA